jgi:hypothetical protein
MTKAYRLSNGVVLETEVELKAYIRGIETTRDNPDTINGLLEEAHIAKNSGPTEETVEAETAAEGDKPEAEKSAD